MQPDHSYHMHSPLAYMSFGYGAHFLTNALTMEVAAAGTRWAMSPDEWSAVAAYLLDGSRWVVCAWIRVHEVNLELFESGGRSSPCCPSCPVKRRLRCVYFSNKNSPEILHVKSVP